MYLVIHLSHEVCVRIQVYVKYLIVHKFITQKNTSNEIRCMNQILDLDTLVKEHRIFNKLEYVKHAQNIQQTRVCETQCSKHEKLKREVLKF